MHRASGGPGGRYWHLWLRVARETDGELEDFAVPVIVSGPYAENGPGGRSWGFDRAGVGRWLVSPSINVLDDDGARQIVAGHAPTARSLWHQNAIVTGVPEDEPWARGEAP